MLMGVALLFYETYHNDCCVTNHYAKIDTQGIFGTASRKMIDPTAVDKWATPSNR